MERTALPPRVSLAIQRTPDRAEAREILGVQNLVVGDHRRQFAGQTHHAGDSGHFLLNKFVVDSVLLAVRGRREQNPRSGTRVGIDVARAVVVEERHGLFRQGARTNALVEVGGVIRHDHRMGDDIRREFLVEHREHRNSGARQRLRVTNALPHQSFQHPGVQSTDDEIRLVHRVVRRDPSPRNRGDRFAESDCGS